MGSMLFKNPAGAASFRHSTDKMNMVGVQFQRFTCKQCGQYKTALGRKRITKHHKDGYRCADCAGAG